MVLGQYWVLLVDIYDGIDSVAEKVKSKERDLSKRREAVTIKDKSQHCDPHLDQTKFNGLLPLTIDGVLVK